MGMFPYCEFNDHELIFFPFCGQKMTLTRDKMLFLTDIADSLNVNDLQV